MRYASQEPYLEGSQGRQWDATSNIEGELLCHLCQPLFLADGEVRIGACIEATIMVSAIYAARLPTGASVVMQLW